MDASLKQRLVGAIIIVALAVIFIPMLFDGSGSFKLTSTKQVAIPHAAQENMQLSPGKATLAAFGQGTTNEATAPIKTSTNQTAAAQSQLGNENKAANASPTPILSVRSVLPDRKEAAPDVANKTSSAQVATAVREKVEHKAVQSGSAIVAAGQEFASLSSSSRLKKKVVTAKRDSTTNRAQKVRTAKVARQYKHKSVAAARKVAQHDSGWAIQLASFSKVANAERLTSKLRKDGYAAYVQRVRAPSGASHARVMIGPHATRATASKLLSKLKQQVKLQGVVIAYQPQKYVRN